MTFRIFSGDARKAIADHIIGAPPAIPNRHGSNHGTDLLVQGGTKTPKYNPDPGGNYDPDPGGDPYPPGGGPFVPPTTGPGGTPVTDCSGAKAADNSGKCPPGIQSNADGSKYQWLRKTDGNGLAYCCPTRILDLPPGTPPPPQTYGDLSEALCQGGNNLGVIAFNTAESNTVKTTQPFAGKTPAQYVAEMKSNCTSAGNSFNEISYQGADDTQRTAAGCCGEVNLDPTPPRVYPPTVTPVTDPVPPIYGHNGATGGDTTPPETSSITCHGPVIQDIAAGKYGYMTCGGANIIAEDDCEKRLTLQNTPAPYAPVGGVAIPDACGGSMQSMMMVLNPSAATIASDTVVVAVKDRNTADATGTILFVPCST